MKNFLDHVFFEFGRFRSTNPNKYFSLEDLELRSIIAESALLHYRNIGYFFFEKPRQDDITFDQFKDYLINAELLTRLMEDFKPKWRNVKIKLDKQLAHITQERLKQPPINMHEIFIGELEDIITEFEKCLDYNKLQEINNHRPND